MLIHCDRNCAFRHHDAPPCCAITCPLQSAARDSSQQVSKQKYYKYYPMNSLLPYMQQHAAIWKPKKKHRENSVVEAAMVSFMLPITSSTGKSVAHNRRHCQRRSEGDYGGSREPDPHKTAAN